MDNPTVVSFTEYHKSKKTNEELDKQEALEAAFDMFEPVDEVLDVIEDNGGYGIAITISPDRGLVVASSFQLDHDDILELLEAAILTVKENH